MNIKEAQEDMRSAYYGGAPGALISGLVWLTAGITAVMSTTQMSVLVFFFGGMLIHPLGILVSKAFKCSGKHSKGNPLSNLAMESTVLLFIGLFIAYLSLQFKPIWFFSIMILIIGARYLIFATIYGMRLYWVFGAALIVTGIGGIFFSQQFACIGILGGILEILFAFLIVYFEKRRAIEQP